MTASRICYACGQPLLRLSAKVIIPDEGGNYIRTEHMLRLFL